MAEKYVCGICGTAYSDLDDYLNCVSKCGEKLKENKHLEEVNAALNGVKQAKNYYEQKLDEFKQKYPKEYAVNFGTGSDKKITSKSVEVSYENNGKDKPKMSAKVDGKEKDIKTLLNDPETKFIAQLLGLI